LIKLKIEFQIGDKSLSNLFSNDIAPTIKPKTVNNQTKANGIIALSIMVTNDQCTISQMIAAVINETTAQPKPITSRSNKLLSSLFISDSLTEQSLTPYEYKMVNDEFN